MRYVKKIVLGIALLFVGISAFAADPAPLAMLKSTSAQMMSELDKHLGNLKGNDALVDSLVNRILVPHFDLITMSRSVVGRDYWQQASASTQQQFVKEFTRYVVKTYSSAIQSYDGERMQFFPIRGDVSGQSRVQVNSAILRKDGPAIQVQYRLVQAGGKWVIYDFSVDGISIIQNYRSQFASTLRQGGLEQLVAQIKSRNVGSK